MKPILREINAGECEKLPFDNFVVLENLSISTLGRKKFSGTYTQILREINFNVCKEWKIAILAILEAQNFDFGHFMHFSIVEII